MTKEGERGRGEAERKKQKGRKSALVRETNKRGGTHLDLSLERREFHLDEVDFGDFRSAAKRGGRHLR